MSFRTANFQLPMPFRSRLKSQARDRRGQTTGINAKMSHHMGLGHNNGCQTAHLMVSDKRLAGIRVRPMLKLIRPFGNPII